MQEEVTAELSSGLKSFWSIISDRGPSTALVTLLVFYIQKTWLPFPALLLSNELGQVTSLLRFLIDKIGLIIPTFQVYCDSVPRYRRRD